MSKLCIGRNKTECTWQQVQSHALLCRGFGTLVPFIGMGVGIHSCQGGESFRSETAVVVLGAEVKKKKVVAHSIVGGSGGTFPQENVEN